jgi:hypothetical protein
MKASEKLAQLKMKVTQKLLDGGEFDFIIKEVSTQIQKRTRLGKGVNDSGELKTLNKLSDKYVNQRKKLQLDSRTTPKKSNLTRTGQMLDAIQGIRNGSLFTFSFKESRDDGEKNSDVAKWAREKGRRFFDLSKSERVGLSRKISQVIKKKIKELFNS